MDETIQSDIETAARILREAGATEVFLFGSAAEGKLRRDSDLDLAVRGMPPEKFYRAMGLATRSISRDLDLIDLDEENLFTDYLQREGQLKRVA